MQCIYQRIYHSSVRVVKNQILAETVYSDIKGELVAKIAVDKDSFLINNASMEIHSRDTDSKVVLLNKLSGTEASFESSRTFKQALADFDEPLANELFTESLRGITQIEDYFYKERGFSSPVEHYNYWEKAVTGTCFFYSNLDRRTRFYKCSNDYQKEIYLFLRFKSYFLYLTENGSYYITGNLIDKHHEMNTTMEISEGRINKAKGSILRVWDPLCKESAVSVSNLTGADINLLSKKNIAGLCGGGQGCIHLIDLADGCINTLKYYLHHPWDLNQTKE